jgi:pimeloyl-ACP methyl ester carboxylesterase
MQRRSVLIVLSLVLIAVAIFVAREYTATTNATPLWLTLPDPAPLPKPDVAGYAPVNDIRMYYEIWNVRGGDPVLLLHGGIGSNGAWGNQVPELMKTHKVIAAESRGNARTAGSQQPLSYELMASDYAALMDYLHVEKPSLVGWSDGAIIAIEMAIAQPARWNKLFAFGANYNAAGLISNYENQPVFSRGIKQQSAISRSLAASPEAFDIALKQRLEMWNKEPNLTADQLGHIAIPTIVADGDHEESIKPEHTTGLARMIPGAKLLWLPNVSHMGLWQDPQTFNKALLRFLDEH